MKFSKGVAEFLLKFFFLISLLGLINVIAFNAIDFMGIDTGMETEFDFTIIDLATSALVTGVLFMIIQKFFPFNAWFAKNKPKSKSKGK